MHGRTSTKQPPNEFARVRNIVPTYPPYPAESAAKMKPSKKRHILDLAPDCNYTEIDNDTVQISFTNTTEFTLKQAEIKFYFPESLQISVMQVTITKESRLRMGSNKSALDLLNEKIRCKHTYAGVRNKKQKHAAPVTPVNAPHIQPEDQEAIFSSYQTQEMREDLAELYKDLQQEESTRAQAINIEPMPTLPDASLSYHQPLLFTPLNEQERVMDYPTQAVMTTHPSAPVAQRLPEYSRYRLFHADHSASQAQTNSYKPSTNTTPSSSAPSMSRQYKAI